MPVSVDMLRQQAAQREAQRAGEERSGYVGLAMLILAAAAVTGLAFFFKWWQGVAAWR